MKANKKPRAAATASGARNQNTNARNRNRRDRQVQPGIPQSTEQWLAFVRRTARDGR
jgi:hypothetical protein